MLGELLWLYGAKQQYDIQKSAGLAGLVALVTTVLIALNWDNAVYPLLTHLGIIEILDKGGLINHSEVFHQHTIINLFVFYVGCLLILGIILAIPTFLLMLILTTMGVINNAPKPILFAMGIAVLPFALIALALIKVLELLGLIKPDKTIRNYSKSNVAMKELLHDKKDRFGEVNAENYIDLFAIQENNEEVANLSFDEAVAKLNISVKSLEEFKTCILGFNPTYENWVMLLPNPVPFYATDVILDKHNESPFNFKKLSADYYGYTMENNELNSFAPNFYTPSRVLDVRYNKQLNQIMVNVAADNFGVVTNLRDLTKIIEVRSKHFDSLLQKTITKAGVQMLNKMVHTYSYLVPLAYPHEKLYFEKNYPFSYYKALEKVPNAVENLRYYQPIVETEVKTYAARGFIFAKELLKNRENDSSDVENENDINSKGFGTFSEDDSELDGVFDINLNNNRFGGR